MIVFTCIYSLFNHEKNIYDFKLEWILLPPKYLFILYVCELIFSITVLLQFYQLVFLILSVAPLCFLYKTFQTLSDIQVRCMSFFSSGFIHLFSSFCKFILKKWIKPDSDLFFFKHKINKLCQASLLWRKMKE